LKLPTGINRKLPLRQNEGERGRLIVFAYWKQ